MRGFYFMLFRKTLLCFLSLLIFSFAFADVRVKGYTRKDGTYVNPHYRSNPDGNFYNNWSTVGNVNPYTGKIGTKTENSNQGKIYKPSTTKDLNIPYLQSSNPAKSTQFNTSQNIITKSVPISSLYSDPKIIVSQRLKNLDYKEDTSHLSLIDMLGLESKISAAQSLKKLGYSGDTSKLTLMEILEIESKIHASKRLYDLGYIEDSSHLSLSEMLGLETKLHSNQRLKSLGYGADTSNLSIAEMLELESRIQAIQRLKNLGY